MTAGLHQVNKQTRVTLRETRARGDIGDAPRGKIAQRGAKDAGL